MRPIARPHLISVVALCSLSVTATALNLDTIETTVTRQVERKTEQMLESAMQRRLERQVEAAVTARRPLASLPARLPIHTREGREAFNDIELEDGSRAAERQWLATGTKAEMASLNQPGITVLSRRELSGLGMTVIRFSVEPNLDSRAALEGALPALAGQLDRNHIYQPQTAEDADGADVPVPGWSTVCTIPVRLGMVDTAIAAEHPALANADLVQKRFLDIAELDSRLEEPTAHGTAVASLLVGSQEGKWPARLPEATLYNASVFYDRDRKLSGATLGHLLEGLNWLAEQSLSVVNISLAGPDNRILATTVKKLTDQGLLLVAAVGNQGPTAPPLYPAAYPEVIGVTAVDSSGNLYRWANRGEQVMFAGPGVSVPVAHPDGRMVVDHGTSLAAPVISAALACHRDDHGTDSTVSALIRMARDLGEPGRDDRFGHGVLEL